MYRVMVLYEQEPDADRYARHLELCRRVPGAVVRHGRVTRTLFGGGLAHYSEFESRDG